MYALVTGALWPEEIGTAEERMLGMLGCVVKRV